MRAKWFSRRWVIQELALATMPHVRLGSQEMSWRDFADAIALFMTKYDTIRRAFGPGPINYVTALSSGEHHIISLDARGLGTNALVTATSNLFRKSNEGKILQRLLSLELLVSSMLLAFKRLIQRTQFSPCFKSPKIYRTTTSKCPLFKAQIRHSCIILYHCSALLFGVFGNRMPTHCFFLPRPSRSQHLILRLE